MNELELCLRWCRQADDLRQREPRRALALAYRTRDLAARAPVEPLGTPLWSALQADVWAVLGSCWRACGDPARAESALTIAWSFLADGPLHDPLSLARMSLRAAHIRADQGRFAEALALIDTALDDFRRMAERSAAAGAAVDKALVLHRAGATPAALECLEGALSNLREKEDASLRAVALHNRALFLQSLVKDSSSMDAALQALEEACAAQAEPPLVFGLLKTCALTALTALKLGRFQPALAVLWRCREGFHRLGAAREELWTLLHLLVPALREEKGDEIAGIAGMLFPLQHSLRLNDEARALLRELIQRAQRHQLNAELVLHLAEALES